MFNGRYRNVASGSPYLVEIRVELNIDKDQNQIQALAISGDVLLKTPKSYDYVFSFVSDPAKLLTVPLTDGPLEFEFDNLEFEKYKYALDCWPVPKKVAIGLQFETGRPITATARFSYQQAPKIALNVIECVKFSDSFREICVHFVRDSGTTGFAPFPPLPALQGMEASSVLQKSGVLIKWAEGAPFDVQVTRPKKRGWRPRDLHTLLQKHLPPLDPSSPEEQIWAFVTDKFDCSCLGDVSDVAGYMFDMGNFDKNKLPRQGFALFLQDARFAGLDSANPMARNAYFFTFLHELGHALGLPHTEDLGHQHTDDTSNRSLMNGEFDTALGNNWEGFTWHFLPEEIRALRHSPWINARAGGGYRNPLPNKRGLALPGTLELRLAAQDGFLLLEPIQIEVRLRNLAEEARTIDARFAPEFRVVRYEVFSKKTKTWLPLSPAATIDASAQTWQLDPSDHPEGTDRCSKWVSLFCGEHAPDIFSPGEYGIRAIYQDCRGAEHIESDELKIKVLDLPESLKNTLPAIFNEPDFQFDFAEFLYIGGSRLQRYDAVRRHLSDFVKNDAAWASVPPKSRPGTERLRAKLQHTLGLSSGTTQLLPSALEAPGTLSFQAPSSSDRAEAKQDFERSLQFFHAGTEEPSQNFAYQYVVEDFMSTFEEGDEAEKAQVGEVARRFLGDMAKRGVPKWVLRKLEEMHIELTVKSD